MIGFIRTVLALLGIVVIVLLAIDNRQIVEIDFWPLPLTYPMPLYAVFLIGVFLGALLGGLAVWLSTRSRRREARRLQRQVKANEYQERLRRERQEAEILEEARRKNQGGSLALAAPNP